MVPFYTGLNEHRSCSLRVRPKGWNMRQRLTVIFLLALLLLAACSKKETSSENPPADQTAATPAPQPAPENNATPETPASTSAGSDQKATSVTPEPPKKTPAQQAMAEAPKPKPKPIVLPAGTVLTVRINEALGSKTSKEGQNFSGAVSSPVTSGGKTVIPEGADATGVVTQAKAAGRFKGGAVLGVSLNSITINGHSHAIQTEAVAQQSTGKGKRTAAMVGGGAGAGALIGGLAGGGKGAAIGALVGAGAGTAGSAFTGNRDITLPAESMLSFKLLEPLTIPPK
jgi:hypothetical protein